MALASPDISFKDIRFIVGVEGFFINGEFIPKEIGFSNLTLNESIPLNFNNTIFKLNNKESKNYNFLYNFYHGLNLFENNITWCNHSDFTSILKVIYKLTFDPLNPNKKYIGYNNDPNIRSLIYKSGLDCFAVNINKIFDDLPSIKTIRNYNNFGHGVYKYCELHRNNSNSKLQCAKVKTRILYEECLKRYINEN